MLKEITNQEEFTKFMRKRQLKTNKEVMLSCESIIQEVINRGDEAIKELTFKFDHCQLDNLQVSKQEIEQAKELVNEEFKQALQKAKENIELYHQAQYRQGYQINKTNNVYLGQLILPIEKVGVYVPGGSASYPSSVLMNVIPAQIAQVKEIIMCTPVQPDGTINPYILYAADLLNIKKIFKVGGAQAIAAMAYGSETIPQVDKIIGPGNAYVAMSKKLVYGQVDIDMIAGPSEIIVVSDGKSNPAFVAADLISQSEHDSNACSILITTDRTLVNKVEQELEVQVNSLPRKEIIKKAFDQYGAFVVVDRMEKGIEIANKLAGEHLEIMCENAEQYLPLIKNAGSIFLGSYSCESVGDYFGGTNHVLPTNGTARFASALNVDNFMKKSCYLCYSREALLEDGPMIMEMANKEGLQGHANAVKVRLDEKD